MMNLCSGFQMLAMSIDIDDDMKHSRMTRMKPRSRRSHINFFHMTRLFIKLKGLLSFTRKL